MTGSRRDPLRAALLALGLLLAVPASAGDTLPARLQASLFRRIFAYDPALRDRPRVRILVLHGLISADRAREMVAAFEAEGLTALPSEIEVRPGVLDDVAAVYAFPDVPAQQLAELVRGRRLLSLGEAEAAERGLVAIALRRGAAGQPEILVHLPRLAADGHELSARLLKLATVLP